MKNMLLGLVVSTVFATPVFAHECNLQTAYMVVPLYKADMLGRLENENRIDDVCPGGHEACKAEALAPQVDVIPFYDAPDGTQAGALHIAYTPGQGIAGAFTRGGELTPFTSVVYDADWGYGPWFHATLLDERGPWKRISLSGIGAGWVNLPQARPVDLSADKSRVYSIGGRNVMIMAATGAGLTIRDEQPGDMWCEGGKKPETGPFEAETVTVHDLYDAECVLRLVPAYPRGC